MSVDLLYWNLNSSRLDSIKQAVGTHLAREAPDILILSETPRLPEGELARQVSVAVGAPVREAVTLGPTRNPVLVREGAEVAVRGYLTRHDGRVGFYEVTGDDVEFLLVVVHLLDARNHRGDRRLQFAWKVAASIRDVEEDIGHCRTLVVGDFNMNPYEPGMTAAAAFNAVSDRIIAAKPSRKVDGEHYRFFYNPSWQLFGDRPSPPGTFCWGGNDGMMDYWHVLDQALVRTDLLAYYEIALSIASADALTSAEGRPSKSVGSDHFPLRVRLEAQS